MGERKLYPEQNLNDLQEEWYLILEKEGFKDIEDHKLKDRPLKRWTGFSNDFIDSENQSYADLTLIDLFVFQEPNKPIASSFPEPLFKQEEEFLNHPEFKSICDSICKHGNSKLTTEKIIEIWQDYSDGKSCRIISRKYNIHFTQIYRTTKKIEEWMLFLSQRNEIMETKVVIRNYEPRSDAAFVYSTWRNSLWYDEKRPKSAADEFYRDTNKMIRDLLLLPNVTVKIACLSDDPDLLVGYSVMTDNLLEWVYVKIDYRTKGVGKLLTKGFKEVKNPETKIGVAIVKSKLLKIKEKPNGSSRIKEESDETEKNLSTTEMGR